MKGKWQLLAFAMRSGSGLTFNGMDPHVTSRLCCQAQGARFEKQHVLKEVAHAAIAAQAGAPPSSLSLSCSLSLSWLSLSLVDLRLSLDRCQRERQTCPTS